MDEEKRKHEDKLELQKRAVDQIWMLFSRLPLTYFVDTAIFNPTQGDGITKYTRAIYVFLSTFRHGEAYPNLS